MWLILLASWMMQQEFYGYRKLWPTCHMHRNSTQSVAITDLISVSAQPSLCWSTSAWLSSTIAGEPSSSPLLQTGGEDFAPPEEMCPESHREHSSVLRWLKPPGVVTFSLKEGLRHRFLSVQQHV